MQAASVKAIGFSVLICAVNINYLMCVVLVHITICSFGYGA